MMERSEILTAMGLGRVKTLSQKTDCGFPRSKALHHHGRARIGLSSME